MDSRRSSIIAWRLSKIITLMTMRLSDLKKPCRRLRSLRKKDSYLV